jgi:hypothetical protein
MGQTTINLITIPKRILTEAEAASHCGRSVKRFGIECPVKPIRFPNGDERYDIQDLDAWLDSLKAGHQDVDVESIVERLG